MIKMKKKLNIVSLDTPPLASNPYALFIVDALINKYAIEYWENCSDTPYKEVCFHSIDSKWRRALQKVSLYLFACWSCIIHLFKGGIEWNGIKEESRYLSFIFTDNLILFAHLFFKAGKKEVFIVINAGALPALRWLKFFKPVRYAYCVYEVYPFQFLSATKLLNRYRCCVEKKGIECADLVIDTGESKISLFLKRIYKIERMRIGNVLVVPPSLEKKAIEKTSFPVRFYYHGIYLPNRGLEELITAMKEIDSSKGVLFMRGIGEYEKELRKIVGECSVQDRVFFLPPVDTKKLSEAATDFDVGLTMVKMNVLNHKFAIGFKTYENMNAGLAIVAPDSFNLHPFMAIYPIGMGYRDATVDELVRVLNYCVDNLEWIDNCKRTTRYCIDKVMGRPFQEQKLLRIVSNLFYGNYR